MKIGVVTANMGSGTIMRDLLKQRVSTVHLFTMEEIDAGATYGSNLHLIIVDYSREEILDHEAVIDLLQGADPICLMSEQDLVSLSELERKSWLNRMLDDIAEKLPDLRDRIMGAEEKVEALSLDKWIIGASAGGSESLRELFGQLYNLPAVLLIVQHHQAQAVDLLLSNARDFTKAWEIIPAADGLKLRPGLALYVPRDSVVEIQGNTLRLVPRNSNSSHFPSIDSNIRSMVKSNTSGKIGLVILSGLGSDGAAAVRDCGRKVRAVYAQEAGSCIAPSMPNSARATQMVTFSGSPAEIAKKINAFY